MHTLFNAFTVHVLGIRNIKPAGEFPGDDIVYLVAAWALAALVVFLFLNIVFQINKLRNAGEAHGDGLRGPAVNIIVSLVLAALVLTKGTGFINEWTGLFA